MEALSLSLPLLWTAFIVPIVAGFVALGFSDDRKPMIVTTMSWLISTLLLLVAVIYVWPYSAYDPLVFDLTPYLGHFALIIDGVSLPFALAIAIVSMLVAIYSLPYMKHRLEELGRGDLGTYYLLYQLFTAGMLGAVLSTNTIEFYLMLELTLILSFLLIAFYGYGDRLRVALLYLVWTHIGAGFYLLGALLMAPHKGFDAFVPGIGYVEEFYGTAPLIAVILMVVGLAVKMALVGVHYWLPHAHAEAPTPISALLSPLLIGVAGYALLRFVWTFARHELLIIQPYLVAWSFITIIYGGLVALRQDDVKRFLAYSSISQMGYLALGFSLLNLWGFGGLELHYVAHAIGKAVLFMVAGTIITVIGTRRITKLGGLISTQPWLAGTALLGLMHLVGIPPALALWSEYLLARGLVTYGVLHNTLTFTLLIPAFILATMISTVYSFIFFRKVFLGPEITSMKRRLDGKDPLVLPMTLLLLFGVLSFFAVEAYLRPMVMLFSSLMR